MNKLVVNLDVSYSIIEGLFVTAFEGGSNYWYLIGTMDIPEPAGYIAKEEFDFQDAYGKMLDKIFQGGNLPVYDIEEGLTKDGFLGVVTKESILYALEMIAREDSDRFIAILDETYDAGDADVFFQYATMGQIVYG